MSRLPYPEDQSLLMPGGDKTLGNLAPLNIFRMLCHTPHLIRPFVSMGTGFLIKGTLAPVTRECVILRVGYLSGASYETSQHEAIGRAIGMNDMLIAAVRAGPASEALNEEQRIALEFTDHLVANPSPDEQFVESARAMFGMEGLAELVLLIGYYMMVCRFLETFGVDIEEGGPRGEAILAPK